MDYNLASLEKSSKPFLLTTPFDRICRTCLILQLEEQIFNIFEETHEDITLDKIYANYISVEIEQNDGLPQNICKSCMIGLVQIYTFVQQCKQSDASLRAVMCERNKDPPISQISIKVDAVLEKTDNTKKWLQNNRLDEHNQENSPHNNETVYPFLSLNEKKPETVNIYSENKIINVSSPKSKQYDNYVDIKHELEPQIYIKQENQDECITNASQHTVSLLKKIPTFWYSCNDCKESFETFNELKQHRNLAKHPRPRNHICSKCKKAFISLGHLQQHMASHARNIHCQSSNVKSGEGDIKNDLSKLLKNIFESDKCHTTVYSSQKCNKIFGSHNELKTHRRQGKRSQPCNYVCSKCCKPVKTSHNLKQHMKVHELELNLYSSNNQNDAKIDDSVDSITNNDPSKLLHSCKQCNEFFCSFNELKLHWKQVAHPHPRTHACSECKKSFISNSKLQQHVRTHTKEKPYSCHICQMQFSASGSLRRHMMQHTGERPHVCEFCGKGFIQTESLVEHRRLHTGETPFECNYCGKCFKHRISYKTHLEGHFIKSTSANSDNGILNNQCEICQRRFTTKATLKTHMLIHGEKKFLCNQCGKGFVLKGGLLTHMKVHTGDKPYACKECNKAFSQIGALKSHARIHTGEKPFVCKLCPKAFTISHHLVYHMRTHSKEKPFKCSYCGKLFAFKANLTVHIRIHTGETPFVCSICGKGFYHSNNMKKHKKVHEKLNVKALAEVVTIPL